MARSVGGLLTGMGVSFGILGSEETCDGNEVRILGETGLFEELATRNISTFSEKDIRKVITLDPHALNTFRKDYGRLGGRFEACHYTEVLARLVRERPGAFSAGGLRVTYHDPCYLGRHLHVYEPPREVLRNIEGLELVEMRRNRADAFCCGGGGGNFFTDLNGPGEDTPARVRVREAFETGAEVVAVACPQCAKMLMDAAKAEGLENRLRIKDVAEIAADAFRS
jgi:Fe-S oxidoreductase